MTIIPDPSAAVDVRSLSHSYGTRQALRGINLTVQAGEIYGLLGPNGGGKTTLFRILSTLMLPSGGGDALLFGVDAIHRPAECRRLFGVVFQSPSLDKKLTVSENLLHQGHLYGLSGSDLKERIRRSLAALGLGERARDRVEKLSGGMQRRVEIAKTLLHQPKLMLLDEPSTGLDPGARHDLWEQLFALRDSFGVTCLLTTHLMEEAENCDRVAIINHGQIIARGTPDDLKSRIGGEVIVMETKDPERLSTAIGARFNVESQVMGESVRLEASRVKDLTAPQLVVALVEAFPGEIRSIRLGKPRLEDVFIHVTGQDFNAIEAA